MVLKIVLACLARLELKQLVALCVTRHVVAYDLQSVVRRAACHRRLLAECILARCPLSHQLLCRRDTLLSWHCCHQHDPSACALTGCALTGCASQAFAKCRMILKSGILFLLHLFQSSLKYHGYEVFKAYTF